MGKAIYNPSGKAEEYGFHATNFYVGCPGRCTYCFNKTGNMKHLWSNKPVLKKTLVDVETSKVIFVKEMLKNKASLQEHGLFFNFTSDPFLREIIDLNIWAMQKCEEHDISVKALTKQAWFKGVNLPKNVCIGFTLTGFDDLEPGADSNIQRIRTMKHYHDLGYKTWASIEPIITRDKSIEMIELSKNHCDLFKIGLLSGKKYHPTLLNEMVQKVQNIDGDFKIYWKEDFLRQADLWGIQDVLTRNVEKNYKMWK